MRLTFPADGAETGQGWSERGQGWYEWDISGLGFQESVVARATAPAKPLAG
jgi:hypothetical protein